MTSVWIELLQDTQSFLRVTKKEHKTKQFGRERKEMNV